MFDLMCSYRKNTWNMKTVKNMNLTMRHIRIKMKVHKCTETDDMENPLTHEAGTQQKCR